MLHIAEKDGNVLAVYRGDTTCSIIFDRHPAGTSVRTIYGRMVSAFVPGENVIDPDFETTAWILSYPDPKNGDLYLYAYATEREANEAYRKRQTHYDGVRMKAYEVLRI